MVALQTPIPDPSPDDTQPRSPFKEQPAAQPGEDEDISAGPGCLVWTLIGVASLSCALVIVLLAATAGWTVGQREALVTATAAIYATAESQLTRIPQDAANGNFYLVERRIQYLTTLLPGMPGLPEIIQTATALHLTNLPTATSSPTATRTPAVEVTLESLITQSAPGAYDLDSLLREAQDYAAVGQWSDAIDTLDVIIGTDGNFQRATVQSLMLEALRSQATNLFNENRLAEAILLTTRAEEFGLSQDDSLRYEKYVAALYLDAIHTIGTDYAAAIRALRAVYDLGPGRYYDDVKQKLFQQYVAYGDAWAIQNEYCPAYAQYESALTILSSAAVAAKRDNANTLCLQATPTSGPGVTPEVGSTQAIAPIGVVETPTSAP